MSYIHSLSLSLSLSLSFSFAIPAKLENALDDIKVLDDLALQSPSFWQSIIRHYFLEAPCISVSK